MSSQVDILVSLEELASSLCSLALLTHSSALRCSASSLLALLQVKLRLSILEVLEVYRGQAAVRRLISTNDVIAAVCNACNYNLNIIPVVTPWFLYEFLPNSIPLSFLDLTDLDLPRSV
jgi:hypothetical protein